MGGVPDVNVADRAKESRGDQFHAAAEIGRCAALIACLRDHLGRARHLTQFTRFRDGVGERFLAIHMFSSLNHRAANRRMPVVGCGDHDRVERLLLFKKHAVIAVSRRVHHALAMALLGVLDLR